MRRALLVLVALLALGTLAAPSAFAQVPTVDELADQQDVQLNADGKATIETTDGDNVQACGTGKLYFFFTGVRNLSGGNSPVVVQAGGNTSCSVGVTVLDKNNAPIRNQIVRLVYFAHVAGSNDEPINPVAP
jgi:hypothetical protein